jgi:hypothetical protein
VGRERALTSESGEDSNITGGEESRKDEVGRRMDDLIIINNYLYSNTLAIIRLTYGFNFAYPMTRPTCTLMLNTKDNQNRNQVGTRDQRVDFMRIQVRRSPVSSFRCRCDCSVMVVAVRRRLINLAHTERRTTRTGMIARKTMLNVRKTGSGNMISVEANTGDEKRESDARHNRVI